jgi:hypothetical protein
VLVDPRHKRARAFLDDALAAIAGRDWGKADHSVRMALYPLDSLADSLALYESEAARERARDKGTK